VTRPPTPRARRLAAAALAALALAGCAAGTLPPVHSEQERLALARRLMDRRDHTNAIELLKTYVQGGAGAAGVDQGIHLLGLCYLRTRDWVGAAAEFERLVRDYPESDSAAAAAFHLGEAWWGQARGPDFDQDNTEKALAQWLDYLRRHPGDAYNGQAERRVAVARTRLAEKLVATADLYWKMRHNGPARAYYRRVADDFADTALLGEALVGLALCDARDGRREAAVAALRELEARFAGTPLGARAARERARVEQGKVKPAAPPKPIVPDEPAPGAAP
jgi:outer membrane protein assembly factor BamD